MKKLLCILMSTLFIFTAQSLAWNAQNMDIGDLNEDGRISLADVMICARYAVGADLAPQNIINAADFNINEKIDLADVVFLLKHVWGL